MFGKWGNHRATDNGLHIDFEAQNKGFGVRESETLAPCGEPLRAPWMEEERHRMAPYRGELRNTRRGENALTNLFTLYVRISIIETHFPLLHDRLSAFTSPVGSYRHSSPTLFSPLQDRVQNKERGGKKTVAASGHHDLHDARPLILPFFFHDFHD